MNLFPQHIIIVKAFLNFNVLNIFNLFFLDQEYKMCCVYNYNILTTIKTGPAVSFSNHQKISQL